MMNGEKKSAQILNLSLASFSLFEREDECLVAPDHDAPSRVLNRLRFAAFVLDFPDVCRKKRREDTVVVVVRKRKSVSVVF